MNDNITYRVADSFDDPALSPERWNSLLSQNAVNAFFLTLEYQRSWWKVFGRGKLLLVIALDDDTPIAIAPLFEDGDMIFFVGSGGSDYLDFISPSVNEDIIENMLKLAVQNVNAFVGFRFYHIPEYSNSIPQLEKVASRLNMQFFEEGSLPAPFVDMSPDRTDAILKKKSLIRHENWFQKNGSIQIEHLHSAAEIIPAMNEFFDQHIKRWESTGFPSLFTDEQQKQFYIELASETANPNPITFTRVIWNGQAIAMHYGFKCNNTFLWYKPSFDISLEKHSPGEVLLRQLFLKAKEDKVRYFDFGLGDEAFKQRFCTGINNVVTIGMYPA